MTNPLIYVIGVLPPKNNKGDEAIYISSLKLVKKYIPESVVALAIPPQWYYQAKESSRIINNEEFDGLYNTIVPHPLDIIKLRSNLFFKVVKSAYYNFHPVFSTKFLPLALIGILSKEGSISSEIKNADANLILSFPFESGNILFSYSFIIPKLLNKSPTISFPISLTTNVNLGSKSGVLAKEALTNVDVIFTRGFYTTQWLSRELKIPREKIVTSVDPAFLLGYEEFENKRRLIKKVEMERESVAFVPSFNVPAEIIMKIVRLMLNYFFHIYIVPTDGKDLEYLRNLNHLIESNKCTLVDTSNMSPSEIRTIFQSTRLVVTFRLHAGIFALTSGIPVVMINRTDDLKFMDVLGHYRMEHYFVDIEDVASKHACFFTTIDNKVKDILDQYSSIRKTIIKRNNSIRDLAELPGRYIRNILRD